MFSKFFIDRPIFATVLAILMVLAGAMTVFTLPVAQYPDITPPTVMVSASYPGADAKTVAEAVGVPIEQAINGVEGMLYMNSSSSSDGSYMLTVTFENGTNIDDAAVEVQNRVQRANSQLPSSVVEQGLSVDKRSSNQVLFCTLEADEGSGYDALYLTNYANLNIVDPLTRVDGVGEAEAFGSGSYSMRIWLDPEAMRMRNLSPSEVEAAIRAQNVEVSAGSVGAEPSNENAQFEYTLVSQGRLVTPDQFGDIILRSNDEGGILRLKDVAKIDLGSESYSVVTNVNGKQTALIGVSQRPGANAIDVANGALKELDRLSAYFPPGVHYNVVMNSTDYVKESLTDLLSTFLLTSLIVMVVILIFLQNWRAVVIPMLTIPVSLIATFAIMKIMGFTLNTLTLFGLVLAIAIVVDDAIVVVEDCQRIVDKGEMTSRQAAEKAMSELTGPVVGEVLVLLSVFIPTAFVSGITGSLYKQFALTIAVSTAFSGFNALTLTPALCALFLKPHIDSKFFIYRWFNTGYQKVENFYGKIVNKMLAKPLVTMLAFIAIAFLGIWGFTSIPTSYIPSEDMGYFMTNIQLPTGASLERTEKVVNSLSERVRKEVPGIKYVMAISGMSFMGGGNASNGGSLMVILEPWKDRGRKESIDKLMAMVDEIGTEYQEASIFSLNPPSIPGLGETSGLQMQLLDINNLGGAELMKAIQSLEDAARKDPRLASVTTMYQGAVPQYRINIDRDKIEMTGVNLDDVYSTLSAYMGGNYVNDFNEFGRIYQVTVKGNGQSRAFVDDINRLSVNNSKGEMVPFSTFATMEPVMGDPSVSRYNLYTTASVTATPSKGTSSSEAIKAMEELVEETLGTNYSYAWTGEAYQETQANTTITFVLVFAIIMTILVLSAQYESWTSPIAVVLSMPIAALGTALGCFVMGQSVSIYTQIGLILLLGMSAKNAILIVEYAMDFRKAGIDIRKAAQDAGVIRFRPIMMTACAFVFGVMPMMFATGAGANSRIELGTAVVFGMALNAIIGTLFVPSFWDVLQHFQEKYLSKIFGSKNPPSTPPESISASDI
ncbi:MAG: efflux RND transporter permease subunit [Muribaculum sp.]|nr:efflux RND transporter permease subunit [Muribaculum sp.]